MPTPPSFSSWLTGHGPLVLAVAVTVVVVVEVARARRVDWSAAATSVTAAAAYFTTKVLVAKTVAVVVALTVYERFRLFDLDPGAWWVWAGAFVARDAVYYWIHRAEHAVPLLWASHRIHHSPTEMSFATAIRMPWMEALYKPVLALWAPLIGIHPFVSATIGLAVLVVGQLQHTECYRRATWLDLVVVTPSAHRVHHGSNERYLDTNFGSMLVIWDRLFGTYVAETEPVRYGVKGDTQPTGIRGVLVGGYPELLRARRHTAAGAR